MRRIYFSSCIFFCTLFAMTFDTQTHTTHKHSPFYYDIFLFWCGYKSISVPTSIIYSFFSATQFHPRPQYTIRIHSFEFIYLPDFCSHQHILFVRSLASLFDVFASIHISDHQFIHGICHAARCRCRQSIKHTPK